MVGPALVGPAVVAGEVAGELPVAGGLGSRLAVSSEEPLHPAARGSTTASATPASRRRVRGPSEVRGLVPFGVPCWLDARRSGISEVMQTRVVDPEVMGYLVHHGDLHLLCDLVRGLTDGQER